MLLIRNANIKTMAGPDLKNGCLLLENGKIAAVGQTVDAPEGVETLDAQGRLLTPGCVEAHCHIGLDNEGMRWEGMDYNEIVEPLTPQLRAIDSINPQDEAFGLALRGGVTTACTGPGSANVVGGTFAIVKLAGKRVDRMILRAPAAMKCAFGENPKGCYGHDKRQSPMTRMAVAALLRELLLLQRGFQPRRHLVHRVAGGFEFVRLAIGDGRVQIAVTDTGNARRQSIQRLGNVAEDVARQIEIGQGDGEQQRCNYRTRVYAGESLKTRKQRFDLFAGLVQLPAAWPIQTAIRRQASWLATKASVKSKSRWPFALQKYPSHIGTSHPARGKPAPRQLRGSRAAIGSGGKKPCPF